MLNKSRERPYFLKFRGILAATLWMGLRKVTVKFDSIIN